MSVMKSPEKLSLTKILTIKSVLCFYAYYHALDSYSHLLAFTVDKILNLYNLLIQIRHEVTPKWYQFGLAVGINQETLDEFANFPPEECIVEISDLWLKTNESTLKWRNVANALKEIGCHRLAEKILTVYKTGNIILFALLELL